MGTALRDAINQHTDSGLHLVAAQADSAEEGSTPATILDSRVSWEPAAKRGRQRQPRLVFEVVDPTSGKTVYAADAPVAPVAPGPLAAGGVREGPRGPAVGRTEPPAPRPVPPAAAPPEPATIVKPAPPPKPAAPEKSVRVAEAAQPNGPDSAPPSLSRDRDAERVNRGSRSSSMPPLPAPARAGQRWRSPTLPLRYGVVYFESAGLADRVIVLQERAAALGGGELSVRFVMTSRKGKKTLEIRCDFYDANGAPAGSVREVELPIREGVPSTIALASRRPAARYVLFVRE
jgi:hypothetical protein